MSWQQWLFVWLKHTQSLHLKKWLSLSRDAHNNNTNLLTTLFFALTCSSTLIVRSTTRKKELILTSRVPLSCTTLSVVFSVVFVSTVECNVLHTDIDAY